MKRLKKVLNIKRINIEEIIIAFLLIQPFMDIYMGVVGERFDIFGISLVTIIRVIFFIGLCIYTFIKLVLNKSEKNKKCIKYTLIYIALVFVYIVLHHLNIVYGGKYFYSKGFYSLISEVVYISRLVFPILLIVIINSFSEIRVKNVVKAIVIVAFIIATVIVATNIFKVSFAAYINSENEFITKNIFEWFTLDYTKENIKLLTSKGFFNSANQISNLLLITLPIVVYSTIKNKRWYNYTLLFIDIIAMIMIGSRVASIGWLPVYVVTIIAILIISLINKKKILLKKDYIIVGLILVINTALIFYSPVMHRQTYEDVEDIYNSQVSSGTSIDEFELITDLVDNDEKLEEYIEKIFLKKEQYLYEFDINEFNKYYAQKDYDKLRDIVLCEYIVENYPKHRIESVYVVSIYNYEEHPEFWLDVFKLDLRVKSNYRELKKILAEEIKMTNDNYICDSIIGFGATTLLNNGYMLESDIISHYYYFGAIGILLFILPYGIILIYACCKILSKLIKEKKVCALNVILCFSIFLAFISAIFSGYVFDDYIVSIFLSSIAGFLLKGILNKECEGI